MNAQESKYGPVDLWREESPLFPYIMRFRREYSILKTYLPRPNTSRLKWDIRQSAKKDIEQSVDE